MEYPLPTRIKGARDHRKKWKDCTRCPLHTISYKVVLWRGQLPAEYLFVGEAPGPSEDVVGYPFVGPSGHLLDGILKDAATKSKRSDVTYCITNLVGCFPGKSPEGEFLRPDKVSVTRCRPRVIELIEMADPKVVITLGRVAASHMVPIYSEYPGLKFYGVSHPSKILRLPGQQQELEYRRVVNGLVNIFKS